MKTRCPHCGKIIIINEDEIHREIHEKQETERRRKEMESSKVYRGDREEVRKPKPIVTKEATEE